jgi:hypothetical protein
MSTDFDDLDLSDLTPEEQRVFRKLRAKAREKELERSVAAKLAAEHLPAGACSLSCHMTLRRIRGGQARRRRPRGTGVRLTLLTCGTPCRSRSSKVADTRCGYPRGVAIPLTMRICGPLLAKGARDAPEHAGPGSMSWTVGSSPGAATVRPSFRRDRVGCPGRRGAGCARGRCRGERCARPGRATWSGCATGSRRARSRRASLVGGRRERVSEPVLQKRCSTSRPSRTPTSSRPPDALNPLNEILAGQAKAL